MIMRYRGFQRGLRYHGEEEFSVSLESITRLCSEKNEFFCSGLPGLFALIAIHDVVLAVHVMTRKE